MVKINVSLSCLFFRQMLRTSIGVRRSEAVFSALTFLKPCRGSTASFAQQISVERREPPPPPFMSVSPSVSLIPPSWSQLAPMLGTNHRRCHKLPWDFHH
ncbi:hypothetical protein INR49_021058 [Caranx melampygus]|nr:hypothetical protein INR49_021058 [Caranx melampygus]